MSSRFTQRVIIYCPAQIFRKPSTNWILLGSDGLISRIPNVWLTLINHCAKPGPANVVTYDTQCHQNADYPRRHFSDHPTLTQPWSPSVDMTMIIQRCHSSDFPTSSLRWSLNVAIPTSKQRWSPNVDRTLISHRDDTMMDESNHTALSQHR